MPADLFRPVVSTTLARRRASLLPVSIAVHVVVLAGMAIAPLVAVGDLPAPARPATRYLRIVMPAPPDDAPRPRPARPAARATGASAPLDAPEGIAEETGREGLPAPVDLTVAGDGFDVGLPATGLDAGFGGAPLEVRLPPPAPRKPVPVGGHVRAPVKLRHVAPVYPEIARRSRVEGIVIVEAVIDEGGRVASTRVLRSSPLLDRAAADAVARWEFSPTLLNGRPVSVVMSVTVVFRLD